MTVGQVSAGVGEARALIERNCLIHRHEWLLQVTGYRPAAVRSVLNHRF
jgi:hypothetical protein